MKYSVVRNKAIAPRFAADGRFVGGGVLAPTASGVRFVFDGFVIDVVGSFDFTHVLAVGCFDYEVRFVAVILVIKDLELAASGFEPFQNAAVVFQND